MATAGVGATAPIVPTSAVAPALTMTPVAAPTTAATAATAPDVAATPDVVAKPDVVVQPASKMDLTALVPAESPDSMTGSAPNIISPKEAAMTPGAGDVLKRNASTPTVTISEEK